jgi:hypothetical protein
MVFGLKQAACLVVGLALVLLCSSCTKKRFRTTYPTEGSVFYNGKPAVGAMVVLHPEEESDDVYRPIGKADKEGYFKLYTYNTDDGAPAGKYAVSIVWPMKSQKEGDSEAGDEAEDALRGRYRDPKTSGLNAEIKSSPGNALPRFDLKD